VTIVRFGFVLLCSGQSNMQLTLEQLWNGTSEAAAAGAFTGRISLMSLQAPQHTVPTWNGTYCAEEEGCVPAPQWNSVSPGASGTASPFSGLCWLTGRAVFEALEGNTPVGLIADAVGGTPIEAWLPPGVLGGECPADEPPCGGAADTALWTRFISPFTPLALDAVLWDQGERDVHCFSYEGNKTSQYPCMERALVRTWRAAFKSTFAFVAVQLPGYLGDCAERNGTYYDCVPGVFNMRLAQAAGVAGSDNATFIPTYDLSCPFGVVTPECPLGSVHNVNKTVVAMRAARSLLTEIDPARFSPSDTDLPTFSTASAVSAGAGSWLVTVSFNASSLALRSTQNCVACCSSVGGDFDVSADGGATWVNGTAVHLVGPGALAFTASGLGSRPAQIRYTANQAFPQCAVVSSTNDLPAAPFVALVS
jgi:hypothetical protein